ncbi:MAG: hypothetical protein ABJF23_16320 [Bryobacteraceae bacterium]
MNRFPHIVSALLLSLAASGAWALSFTVRVADAVNDATGGFVADTSLTLLNEGPTGSKCFNSFNHPKMALPLTTVSTSTLGSIISTKRFRWSRSKCALR